MDLLPDPRRRPALVAAALALVAVVLLVVVAVRGLTGAPECEVTVGDRTELFTHVAAPVMTRLRQPQRQVLDTLVDAGVARSRSEALAWCVKLVGEHTDSWLADLRSAMAEVDKLRSEGPQV